jgi:hypothetical protein
MIVEPVVSVILHCSRCNTPLLGSQTDTPAYWDTPESIAETFQRAAGKDVCGWRRVGDRYLCEDCHTVHAGQVVEKSPPRPVEQATTQRMQHRYALQVGQLAAYLTPAEASR